jgi:hypothetical protein
MVARAFLVVCSAVVCAWSVQPLQASVKEPKTKVSFESELPGDFVLVGVGHRKKYGFNIYAAAAYVHRSGLEKMLGSERPLRELISGSSDRMVIMHFVRKAPGDKIQETFTESLGAILNDSEKKNCAEELKRLHDTIGVDAPKGTRVMVSYRSGTVEISAAGQTLFKTSNPTMTRALYEVYFGGKTIIPSLVKDVKARIQGMRVPAEP